MSLADSSKSSLLHIISVMKMYFSSAYVPYKIKLIYDRKLVLKCDGSELSMSAHPYRFCANHMQPKQCLNKSLTWRAVSPRQDDEALYPMATVFLGHENKFASVMFFCSVVRKLSTRRLPLLQESQISGLVDFFLHITKKFGYIQASTDNQFCRSAFLVLWGLSIKSQRQYFAAN